MGSITSPFLLLSLLLFSTLIVAARKTYIVQLKHQDKPESFASYDDWYADSLQSHSSSPDSLLYSYTSAFHGFAASLDYKQVESLRNSEAVLGVYEDTVYTLHTTRTPQFLGLDSQFDLWKGHSKQDLEQASGDVIIGVLDTGVWPESKSFDDTEMPEIPKKWRGECESGPDFSPKLCNKKLIGARSFSKGFNMASGGGISKNPKKVVSPRDSDGHGTHTASTAAGSRVANASLLGYASGNARGMAIHARVAAYKVCWSAGCFGSDILAGMDRAILDGVDVLSLSLGGGSAPYNRETVAIGAFTAMEKGIFVFCSAGNSGPEKDTFANVAPWIMTVGPNMLTPQILKPDVIGPGDDILAAWSEAVGPTGLDNDTRKAQFNILSGTSMSCPHISGLAALLKAAHPEWSPSAIKSALMTTAYNQDKTSSPLRDAADGSMSNPWAHGEGHVDPQKALSPGLVYDISAEEYITFLCSLDYTVEHVKAIVKRPNITCSTKFKDPGQLNYPSFSVVFGNKRVVRYTRTLTNVGSATSTYNVTVDGPSTVGITVKPTKLVFRSVGEKQRYTVTFVARGPNPTAKAAFGSITWVNAQHQVKSPVSFSWTRLPLIANAARPALEDTAAKTKPCSTSPTTATSDVVNVLPRYPRRLLGKPPNVNFHAPPSTPNDENWNLDRADPPSPPEPSGNPPDHE